MFDLERALAAWRRRLRASRVFLADDLDELESHLRDHIDRLVAGGLSVEEAFHQAVRRLGTRSLLETAYRNVRWGRRKRRRQLLQTILLEIDMLKNYLTTALRNLRRHTGYAFINIIGLAVGLAACLLILLFVRNELSYDHFHTKADRIFRVAQNDNILATSGLLAPSLEQAFPEVEYGLRLSRRWPEALVTHDGEAFYEDGFFFTDSTFFEVFSFALLQGDPNEALTRPFSLVVTASMAEKLFGQENPMGQTVNLKGIWDAHDFEVTGVMEDPPLNSHLTFKLLASYSTRFFAEPYPENIEAWGHIGDLTYIVLDKPGSLASLKAKTPAFYARHERARGREVEVPDEAYTFQPVTDIHLHSKYQDEIKPGGEVRYLYIFSAIALLILLIASINYMNLATARSAHRAREVGVRKVVGAGRGQLIRQFFGESLLTMLFALVLALIVVVLVLPAFNQLTGKALTLDVMGKSGFWIVVLGIGLGVGLLAGVYPAVFISRFRPVRVLKGLVSTNRSNARFRNGLVVAQFVISITLIAGTLVIQHQLDYMQNKRLGLNPEQVVVLSARDGIGRDIDAFRTQLLQHSNVLNVTVASPSPPARTDHLMEMYPQRPGEVEELKRAYSFSVGKGFLETLDIPLVEGRNFRPDDFSRDRTFTPILINETSARTFGWDDPIGKEFACCLQPTPRVIGVVKDFHFQSLKEAIAPMALMPAWWARTVLIRVRADRLPETLAYIEDTWQTAAPGYPFDYTFMDARFAQLYNAEERLAQVFRIFSALAILIACLGLFGLAAFMAEYRTKEIGIRKVLGASVSSIVVLFSRSFLKLVALGVMLSIPPAYLLADRWLQDFAYRTEISGWIFLMAGLAALGVAFLAVWYQTYRAARVNPVESLRYE